MKRDFDRIPDDARLWVLAAPRPLTAAEAELLRGRIDDFVSRWAAHGAPVEGASELRYDHFLLLAADEAATGVSGCSQDSMYDAVKAVERELGVTLLDAASRVWYRDAAGAIRAVPRADFRALVERGEVGPDTVVFDNTAATVGAVRNGAWERPMRDSWHARAFRKSAAA
ncbi:MAG TPA: hypothetical protein VFL93_12425 [Longimicrobiaceae bacterium]|nr:hypothetical protein [Longimicrobiaceae bacterium]